MKVGSLIKPGFLIVGAQKCGTTWLWEMLRQHPGTDLPKKKEPHFFSKSYKYKAGMDSYYDIFKEIDPTKVTGEASTSYLYDKVRMNVHLELKHVKIDESLPTIPELITRELPDIMIFILLRDPVERAISAHYHNIRACIYSPLLTLRETVDQYPNRLIVEFGQYLQYIKLWMQFVPSERLRIYIFEEDVVASPIETIKNAYRFLSLDTNFKPDNLNKPIHTKMDWSNLFMNYYLDIISKKIRNKRLRNITKRWPKEKQMPRFINKIAYNIKPIIGKEDIEMLRSAFLPEKEELEHILGRSLNCWSYDYKNRF